MQTNTRRRVMRDFFILLGCSGVVCPAIHAQTLSGDALVDALKAGGYVIVMRHADSPRTLPDESTASPGNVDHERQLDERGRETATAMGDAFRELGIPVGEVLSSPTFRAVETVQHLDLGEPQTIAELGDGGQGMKRDSEGERSAWLLSKAAEAPPAGSNRLIVTHYPNLLGAFGDDAAQMRGGEAIVLRPDGSSARVVSRIPIEEWPALAGG